MSLECIATVAFFALTLLLIFLISLAQKKNLSKRRKGSYHSGEGSSSYYGHGGHDNRGDSYQEHGEVGGREGSHGHDHSHDSYSGSDGDSGGSDGGGGNGGDGGGE